MDRGTKLCAVKCTSVTYYKELRLEAESASIKRSLSRAELSPVRQRAEVEKAFINCILQESKCRYGLVIRRLAIECCKI